MAMLAMRNRKKREDGMGAHKSHFLGLSINLYLVMLAVILFTAIATTLIVTWSALLPEAQAFNLRSDAGSNVSQYVVLHESVSWHYTASLHHAARIEGCFE